MSEIHGADVSTLVPVDGWTALKQDRGVSLGIVRCYLSTGHVDPNAAQCLANAQAAGIDRLDVYHFPNIKVDADVQVNAALGALAGVSDSLGFYWLDVEDAALWSQDRATNVAFLQALIDAVEAAGLAAGIYTVSSSWRAIMGSDTSFTRLPLWYAAPDGVTSFADYERGLFGPIGGWTQPTLKQFTTTEMHAGVSYDGNWAPEMPAPPRNGSSAATSL